MKKYYSKNKSPSFKSIKRLNKSTNIEDFIKKVAGKNLIAILDEIDKTDYDTTHQWADSIYNIKSFKDSEEFLTYSDSEINCGKFLKQEFYYMNN